MIHTVATFNLKDTMAGRSEARLAEVIARLALAQSQDEEEAIGRSELASLIFHGSPALLETVLKEARRNNPLRRALSAARYYSGLDRAKCDRIDAFLEAPFPAQRSRR